MADYYSLLARAVANLPKSSPPSTRRAIYDRARKALTNQLRSLKPQLPESDIAREERALDEAVAKLEAEFEPALAEIHTLPLAPAPVQSPEPPPAPPANFAAEADGELAEPEPPPPPPPSPPPRPEPAILRAPAPPVRPMAPGATARAPAPRPMPSPPPAPPPPPPSPSPSGGLPNAAAFKAPLLGGVEPADDVPEPVLSPVVRAYTEESAAPPLGASAAERAEPARPVLNESGRRKAPTWLWVAGAVAVGFAASVAGLALLMRPALQDLTQPAPIDTPVAPVAPEKQKIRIGSPAPAPTEAPSPTPTAEASVAPSPTATPEPPPPTVAASPTPTASAAPAPAPAPTLPIASRAAMLVATVADAAKPQISVGNAVWSLVPAPAGQPPSAIGVKSEVDIPDLKMHASMILRKNFDTSLPASHTIDLRVSFDAGSTVKGIKDIALPLMRRDDPPAADALTGVRVKISDNYFLVGLNRGDAEIQRNVQEIAERGWFDFPMQLDDDRIAKLTFEKGSDGEKVVAQALAAWK